MDQELTAYIEAKFAEGATRDEIADSLVAEGWPKDRVRRAIFSVQRVGRWTRIFRKEVPVWAFMAVIFVIVSGSVVLFLMFRNVVYQYQLTLAAGQSEIPLHYGSWPALENIDLFDGVLRQFIDQKATFIVADLATMNLDFYEDGMLAKSIPILAKGQPGSWQETPTGIYRITAKMPTGYLDSEGVSIPWMLRFEGPFMIHGWPTYPDGTPVPSPYSAGCIRLSTANAKKLYGIVPVGTPVLVVNSSLTDHFDEQFAPPLASAQSYLAADLESDFVLVNKNAAAELPMGSTTKLMTAIVAVDYTEDISAPVVSGLHATTTANVQAIISQLPQGASSSMLDLLNVLFSGSSKSSNEAALAIADSFGEPRFISLMNQKAASIGMKNTHFTDPAGNDSSTVSTANDLFTLSQYLYSDRSFVLGLSRTAAMSTSSEFLGGIGSLAIFHEPFSVVSSTDPVVVTTTYRPIVLISLGSNDPSGDLSNFSAWVRSAYQ